MANTSSQQPTITQHDYADAFVDQMGQLGKVLPEPLVDTIGALASDSKQLPFAVVKDAIEQFAAKTAM